MPVDFSIIAQSPEVRAIVQDNLLARAFHDALFPNTLFRGEAAEEQWQGQVGDRQFFTATGLMEPDMEAIKPGVDPEEGTYTFEQWEAQLQQYGKHVKTQMPTSMVALANLFLRDIHTLGLQAAQTMNRKVRDLMYNAGLSGWTVVDGVVTASTSVPVKRLNGLTRARRPDLTDGSPVRFDRVSTDNPLPISIEGQADNTIVGYTPDTAGDEIGPGTLTLGSAVTIADRVALYSYDRTALHRVGGGNRVDDIGNTDILQMADLRVAIARFRNTSVPKMPSGRYHCHLDPISETQVFSDPEFQRLNTSLPDYYMYKDLVLGEIQGTVFFSNQECPQVMTVGDKTGNTFSLKDPFAGELWNVGVSGVGSVPIHRALFVGQASIIEKWCDLGALITDAGITGKVGEFSITNNGIDVMADRIQLILRAPLDIFQNIVTSAWKFIGDWPVRTDCATFDSARYKRLFVIEHGASS